MLKNRLNSSFVSEIESIFNGSKDEIDSFFASYNQIRTHAIRFHGQKSRVANENILKNVSDSLSFELPFWPNAWILKEDYISELKTLSKSMRLGNTAAHASGLIYLQEPSAMQSVALLRDKIPPAARVLDLCAAPGGKTTQLIDLLDDQAFMIANEPHRERAQILSENVERWGHPRVVVTQAEPHELSQRFCGWFDVVVVDAPCSGEGMFRKDETAIIEWSVENVKNCSIRQKDILTHALQLLAPNGSLLYSTCTFNRYENEFQVEWLLEQDKHLEVIEQKRIWPHHEIGEGHFVALLKRNPSQEIHSIFQRATHASRKKQHSKNTDSKTALSAFQEWKKDFDPLFDETWIHLTLCSSPGEPLLFGDQLYWMPHPTETIRLSESLRNGLKLIRPGLHLGSKKGKHWTPAHALALSIPLVNKTTSSCPRLSLLTGDSRIDDYFRGQSLELKTEFERSLKGWALLTVDDVPAGWVKCSDGVAKNHYPHGLRRNI